MYKLIEILCMVYKLVTGYPMHKIVCVHVIACVFVYRCRPILLPEILQSHHNMYPLHQLVILDKPSTCN